MSRFMSERYIRVAPAVSEKISELLKGALEGWDLTKVEQDEAANGIQIRAAFVITIPDQGKLNIRGTDMVGFIAERMAEFQDDEALLNAGKLFEKPVVVDDEEDDELEAFGPGKPVG